MPTESASATTTRTRASARLALPEHDRRIGLMRWDLVDEHGRDFTVRVASTGETRERAFRLAGRVYARLGYGEEGPNCSAFDTDPAAFTALAVAADGADAGTISLYFDSPRGLPCDAIYHDRLAPLRDQGRRLVEVARLAIDEPFTRSKALLVALFQCISIYARRVMRFDDLIIEVNPRHVSFYERSLGFVPIGEERPCPRVCGAPAVLLRLDLEHQVRLIRGLDDPAARAATRLLYASYLPLEDERPIADLLAREHRPMSPAEARFFGLGGGGRTS
jgi:hypothetical protein